jgi:ParB family chromosome partitioning protein
MGLSQALKELRTNAGLPEPVPPRQTLSIDEIQPNPGQPRREIDETSTEFGELVESIRLHGLIQPVAVFPVVGGYLLVGGERRWRAFRQLAAEDPARWGRIPVTVLETPGGDVRTASLVLGLLENVVRDDLRAGERAAAIARLAAATGWAHEKIADFLGLSLRTVSDLAAIAQQETVVEALNEGRVTQSQAARAARAAAAGEHDGVVDLVGRMTAGPSADVATDAGATKVWDPSSEPATQTAHAIRLGDTPLCAVKPRVTTMSREDYRALVRELHRSLRQLS